MAMNVGYLFYFILFYLFEQVNKNTDGNKQ